MSRAMSRSMAGGSSRPPRCGGAAMTDQEVKLIKYDAACRAIAEAKRGDEVKRIRDVSIALKEYARQARNYELEADAIEIRMRATRRMDQMRQEQKATVELAKGGRPYQRKATGGDKSPGSNARRCWH